ncbi:acylneuraminate cytidylyltransferase family protein [Lederbergia sp. NSJ-179]|uniref:acylneuraminate cytidylyltransferase family protein n=1 Tax=Lederbergia sp. NSJ-179 TaxID=2931402 RepID=UPI001FD3ED92|nr:acylneuraminate cytidylyltransferase family protein [Lederbergia sp. NSJ-179]MCJ7841353.1 acylneuraminate cytidylyltransferase family protein [Lederbergia sp. NSJ-179]
MIALIPARGGSKGIPRKNIKNLNGSPLISYTIKAALEAGCFSRVIVSTDSQEIADVAKQFGAEIPFLRPHDLATDSALAIDTYLYTMNRLRKEGSKDTDIFTVLLPTTPLRTVKNIQEAILLFHEHEPSSLVSVTKAPIPLDWYMVKDNENILQKVIINDSEKLKNRQDERDYFIPNGAIYILRSKLLETTGNYYFENTIGYEMKPEESIDIDTPFEFFMAECILKERFNLYECS